jgi:hypothetical protein
MDIAEVIIEDVTGYELPPFIPTRGNIKDCCGAIFKGEDGFKRLAKLLRWDDKTKRRASGNLHWAKEKTGRKGKPNVEMCSKSGNIIDPVSKEVIGNLYD